MAALPPLEKAVRNGSLSPAGKYLEAVVTPSCLTNNPKPETSSQWKSSNILPAKTGKKS